MKSLFFMNVLVDLLHDLTSIFYGDAERLILKDKNFKTPQLAALIILLLVVAFVFFFILEACIFKHKIFSDMHVFVDIFSFDELHWFLL